MLNCYSLPPPKIPFSLSQRAGLQGAFRAQLKAFPCLLEYLIQTIVEIGALKSEPCPCNARLRSNLTPVFSYFWALDLRAIPFHSSLSVASCSFRPGHIFLQSFQILQSLCPSVPEIYLHRLKKKHYQVMSLTPFLRAEQWPSLRVGFLPDWPAGRKGSGGAAGRTQWGEGSPMAVAEAASGISLLMSFESFQDPRPLKIRWKSYETPQCLAHEKLCISTGNIKINLLYRWRSPRPRWGRLCPRFRGQPVARQTKSIICQHACFLTILGLLSHRGAGALSTSL